MATKREIEIAVRATKMQALYKTVGREHFKMTAEEAFAAGRIRVIRREAVRDRTDKSAKVDFATCKWDLRLGNKKDDLSSLTSFLNRYYGPDLVAYCGLLSREKADEGFRKLMALGNFHVPYNMSADADCSAVEKCPKPKADFRVAVDRAVDSRVHAFRRLRRRRENAGFLLAFGRGDFMEFLQSDADKVRKAFPEVELSRVASCRFVQVHNLQFFQFCERLKAKGFKVAVVSRHADARTGEAYYTVSMRD